MCSAMFVEGDQSLTRGRLRLYALIACVVILVAAGAVILFPKTGFGQQDRVALARQTVKVYWADIGHGKVRAAYRLLTSGNRQARPFNQYSQDMFGFLTHMAGVTAKVRQVQVNGDQAVVGVSLYSPLSASPLKAYQHLYWESGAWRISDTNGGVSTQK